MVSLFLKIELFLFTLYTFSYLLNVFRQTALSFLSALQRHKKLGRGRVICVTHGWYCALLPAGKSDSIYFLVYRAKSDSTCCLADRAKSDSICCLVDKAK